VDYRLRAWGLILGGYAAGVLGLARAGLVGSGRLYLLALSPVAITLVGMRSGIVAALLSLLTYCGFALVTVQGELGSWLADQEALLPLSVWIGDALTFAMLLALVTVLVGLVVRAQTRALVELRAAHQVLMAREEERTRLARDLHDTVLQQLLLVKRRLFHPEEGGIALSSLLDETTQTLRRTIDDQRNPLLDQGAPVALEGLVEETQRWAGPSPVISWRSSVTDRLPLSEERVTALYRIAQELLANALKHGQAQNIAVTLDVEPGDTVQLCITDDGVGMSPSSPENWGRVGHHGLTSVGEWAAMINASLHVGPAQGKGSQARGTRVTVRFLM
jgi:signal transduction histidine kinase